MNDIYLNDDKVVIDEKFDTLLELIARIEEMYVPKGWIVTRVKLDGDSIDEFTTEDGSLLAYDDDVEIRVYSRRLNDILISTVTEFEKYLKRLVPGLTEVAALFRDGLSEDANALYIEIIEGVRVMIELLQGIENSNQIDWNAPIYQGESLLQMTNSLKDVIGQLVTAQQDYNAEVISSLLENELKSHLERWQVALPEISNHLKE